MEERQVLVDSFQTPGSSLRILVCTIKAAGVGLTLTAASQVGFVEFGWTPADHDQAEDRAHRIGQEDSVNVWYLVCEGTIEEDIVETLDEKRKVVDAIVDGKASPEDTLLVALLKKISANPSK
jgi:SWI/SNF-related matrix-associated actin-dependent regulator 1 of chromatin subfamily A